MARQYISVFLFTLVYIDKWNTLDDILKSIISKQGEFIKWSELKECLIWNCKAATKLIHLFYVTVLMITVSYDLSIILQSKFRYFESFPITKLSIGPMELCSSHSEIGFAVRSFVNDKQYHH